MDKSKDILLRVSLLAASVSAVFSALNLTKSFKTFRDTISSIDMKDVSLDIAHLTDAIIYRQE